jgi:antirestriction protein ArdC
MTSLQINSESGLAEEPSKNSIYAEVTEMIVEELKRGVFPWTRPWETWSPLRSNGEPYKGINALILYIRAQAAGYANPTWLTFVQVKALGGYVRRGERKTTVVYASKFTKSEKDVDGIETEQEIFFLKQYAVFNAEQCNGLPSKFSIPERKDNSIRPIEQAERFFNSLGAEIRIGGNEAFYYPSGDYVQMPRIQVFRDAESYAATKAHELVHWTGHSSRLNRNFGGKRFCGLTRAMEELVAELGTAFLCGDLNISTEVRQDQINYIGYWLQILENDHRAIFTAASMASKAVDYLHALANNTR